ncbi:hypothetical protein BGZ60DRAFT_422352 [Tricladium varicosporioides]|nr:hypothetical protein BGZ60DRAFT_422352 [Hymenoscyphus varicosporioides]
MASHETLIPSWPVPKDDLPLGILFRSLEAPEEEFCPNKPQPYPRDEVIFAPIPQFSSQLGLSGANKGTLQITKALSTYLKKDVNEKLGVEAVRAANYTLKNSGDKFEKLCEDTDVRKWLEKRIAKNHKVYMLVGKQTLTNSHFSHEKDSSSEGSSKLQAPVGDIVTKAAGIPVDVTQEALDVTAEGKFTEERHATSDYHVRGEMIWSIKYRSVTFDWWTKKTLENAKLGKSTIWVPKKKGRGAVDEADDILEAVLLEEEETFVSVKA